MFRGVARLQTDPKWKDNLFIVAVVFFGWITPIG
jgi:hypothetical protein